MLKKILVSGVVLALTSSAALAGHNYKGDYKGEVVAPCPTYQYLTGPYLGLSAGVRNNYTGAPVVYKGLEGTISAGYSALLTPSFYLAGEIFAGDSIKLKDYKAADGSGAKSTWSYGISLLPGYMITDHVLGYVRLGGLNTRFSDQGTTKSAWQVGVGGQTNVYENWDIRGEYVYSNYSKVSAIGKVQVDQFNLGVVYKFV